jgi:MoaA/NifB/PqqE/SkfB family radical SAM enzyme
MLIDEARDIDITSLWHQQCGHLLPLVESLPDHVLRETCPQCGLNSVLAVRSHLRIGETQWLLNRRVRFCASCKTFCVPASELASAIPGVHHSDGTVDRAVITLINPKVWTTQELILNLEPTTKCNFNCWYCVGRHMKQEELTLASFETILNNCPGVQLLALVGEGEPLLHRDIFSMIGLAKKKDLLVYSLTNGSLINQKTIPRICASGLDYLAVSIDSTNKDTFAESRIRGDLIQIWENLDRLQDYKRAHGLTSPHVSIKGTIFPHTREEIPQIIEEAKKHGAEFVEYFQPLNPKSSYVSLYPINKRALAREQNEVVASIAKAMEDSVLPDLHQEIAARLPGLLRGASGTPIRPNCDIPVLYSLLSGQVTPCCLIKEYPEKHWNLKERSIHSIINDPSYENMRFNLWNGFFLPECLGCAKTQQSNL